MNLNTLVVADDLTGASDAGIQFAKAGLRTTVWLDPVGTFHDEDSEINVVDMESRSARPDEAYARMRHFATELGQRPVRRIVKKMDSTLRGNVGPELRALLEALPAAFAVVAPAYPKNGRTCVDGVLLVDGTPVDRTDFGRDLFSPVHDARVAAHLHAPAIALTLDIVRAGTAAIESAIAAAEAHGIRIAVADAQTDDDLRALVAFDMIRSNVLWVGSAGLIEMLPLPASAKTAAPAIPRVAGPLLFVVGSISAMTQRQISDYAAHGAGQTTVLDPIDVLEGLGAGGESDAAQALASGRDVLFALDGDRERIEAALAWGRARVGGAAQTSAALLTRFIAAVSSLITRAAPAVIVLSGGDVARAFCEAYGVRGLALLAEVTPGIPVSRAIGAEMLLVTKAGGFGRPETYRDIIENLRPQVSV